MYGEVDWESRVDWDELRSYRMRRLVEEIAASNVDGLLLTKLDAIRYAISFRPVTSIWFHGTRYVLLLNQDGAYRFLVASGDYDRTILTMPWLDAASVVAFPLDMAAGVHLVQEAIKELGLRDGTLGVDLAPYRLFEPLLQTMPSLRFADSQRVLDRARMVKHNEEIKVLRRAAEVADAGAETALSLLRPGVREDLVAAAAGERMLAEGAEEITHRPLVESGPHSWLGYRFPTDRRMHEGDMVYLDCGSGLVNGYVGDIARVAVVGKGTREQADVYAHLVRMLEAGTDALRPGAPVQSVVDAVRSVVAGTPYQDLTYFGIIGHGIGTDMHEPPIIGERVVDNAGEDEILQPNMVVCLEPGIVVPGVGGGHVENMILVGPDGPESLTSTRMEDELLERAR